MDGIVENRALTSDEMAAEAWEAMGRQNADEALQLWERLRQHFPDRLEGHIYPVQALWQTGRLDEAEAMAAAVYARFPDNPEMYVQFAWIAMLRQRWGEAVEWWAKARAGLAEPSVETYTSAARALWQAGRLDEAKALADDGLALFPDSIEAQIECAWVAEARQDWEGARRLWSIVAQRTPERADGAVGVAKATRLLGHTAEAERMAGEAVARFPDSTDVRVEHVLVAASREDWAEAARRLEAVRDKLQEDGRFEDSLGWIEYRVRSELRSDADAPANSEADLSAADLMLSFESLGERCDFGAVQRKFGVEPLGLFRFAFTRFDPLIAALEDRFVVIGSEEDTGFELYNNENILIMKKYGLVFHTFVDQTEHPSEEKRNLFRQQQRRRLAFLRDKLIADLEEPQKIYVYSSEERATDTDARRLFKALRAYGPNSLLYVRPATESRPLGTVEALEDGLYAGYFSGMADFVAGQQPPFELWREICARTFSLARAATGPA